MTWWMAYIVYCTYGLATTALVSYEEVKETRNHGDAFPVILVVFAVWPLFLLWALYHYSPAAKTERAHRVNRRLP